MSDNLSLAWAWIVGVLLGVIFFGGLWWTVRTGLSTRRPDLWFVCSMVLRISIVMTGFYFMLDLPGDSWKTLLAGLVGFIITRLAATRLVLAKKSNPNHQE